MIAHVGRIWEVADTRADRPWLRFVKYDADAGTLTASDSYIAARVPCTFEKGDESGLIPALAIKAARGKSLAIRDGKAILALDDGERSWNLGGADVKFPDLDGLIDEAEEAEVRYGFNPDLLRRIGIGLGAGGSAFRPLVLHPGHPLQKMRVEGPDGAVGLIMPIRLKENGLPSVHALADDAQVVAAVRQAAKLLDQKRGVKRAAQAFREGVAA